MAASFARKNSSARSVRRYHPNGILDTNFVSKVGGTDLNALVCLPDDKILVGGTFNGVGTVAIRNLARLNSDGSLDTTFVTGSGPNSTVYAIAPVRNGKALIAGAFTSFDGLSRTGIARIFLDAPTTPAFVTQPKSATVFAGQPIRLSVAVNAALPITYQWKKDGQPLPDATNSVFYLASAGQTDAGSYTVEVTTPNGSATSLEAVVTVALLTIGANASLQVSGSTIKLSYPSGSASSLILQFTDQFPGNWQDFGPVPNGGSTELPVAGTQRFYRLKLKP